MTLEHFDTSHKNEHVPIVKESREDVPAQKIETPEDLETFVETKKSEATTESENLIAGGDNTIDNLVENIGASPDDATEGKSRLSQISEKVKGNLKSFMLKVSMVGALGGAVGQSEAMAIDPPTDKEKGKALAPKENVVYISDPKEYAKRAKLFNDSLRLHNEGIRHLQFKRAQLRKEVDDYNKNKSFLSPKVHITETIKDASEHPFLGYEDADVIQPSEVVFLTPSGSTSSRNEINVPIVEQYKKPVQRPVFVESKTPVNPSPKKEIPIKSETVKPTEKIIYPQKEKDVDQIEIASQEESVAENSKPESSSNKESVPSPEQVMKKSPTKERISYTTFLNEKNPEFDYVKDEELAKRGDPVPYFRVKKEG